MSLTEFRRLAMKINQHMQQLAAQGVNDAHDRLAGFTAYALQLPATWRLKVDRAWFKKAHFWVTRASRLVPSDQWNFSFLSNPSIFAVKA